MADLEEIFTPLSDYQSNDLKIDKRKAKSTWLRLYAIRVDKSVYIITGGSIKLTQKMQNRGHTMHELKKLESCKNFLIQKGIEDIDDIIEFIEA
ncbi:MAG: hypothetical protein P1P82_16280 [Bacteroidales bacterium]|nr:hypothetical protein [Bacteroidales bacterium]MDT8432094.1 hypothetical protein [Bacteroidales bacterium]